jgi:hypothetical protein
MSYFQNTSLSPSTIQTYEPRIRKWKEIVPGQSLDYIILFPKQSIRLLSQHLKEREITEKRGVCTMTNLRNYISAILAILRYSPHVAPRFLTATNTSCFSWGFWTKPVSR